MLGFITRNLIIKAQSQPKSNHEPEFNSEETLAAYKQNVPDCRCSLAVGLVLKMHLKANENYSSVSACEVCGNPNPALAGQMLMVWNSVLKLCYYTISMRDPHCYIIKWLRQRYHIKKMHHCHYNVCRGMQHSIWLL